MNALQEMKTHNSCRLCASDPLATDDKRKAVYDNSHLARHIEQYHNWPAEAMRFMKAHSQGKRLHCPFKMANGDDCRCAAEDKKHGTFHGHVVKNVLARIVVAASGGGKEITKTAKHSRFLRVLRLLDEAVQADTPCSACKTDHLSCMTSKAVDLCLMCNGRQSKCSFKHVTEAKTGENATRYGRVMIAVAAVADKIKHHSLEGAGDALKNVLIPAIDDFARSVGIGTHSAVEEEAATKHAQEISNGRKLARGMVAAVGSWLDVDEVDERGEHLSDGRRMPRLTARRSTSVDHPHPPTPTELLYALHPKNRVKLRDAEMATATGAFLSNAPSSSTSVHTQMHRYPLLAQMDPANDPWFAAHGLPWNAEDPNYKFDETGVPEGFVDEACNYDRLSSQK